MNQLRNCIAATIWHAGKTTMAEANAIADKIMADLSECYAPEPDPTRGHRTAS